jgi:protein tyrosine phosphatase (PTP) superfamily phosphohydrolase (DUF442 family)
MIQPRQHVRPFRLRHFTLKPDTTFQNRLTRPMIMRLFDSIHRWERGLHAKWGKDISTPDARRGAWWHYQLLDHGFLRHLWTNFDEFAPGAYRSNQPDAKRLKAYAAKGIKTVLNLRGPSAHSPYLFEREACAELALQLVDLSLKARSAPTREALLELIDLFPTLPRPFLLHCKSGADRAGLASAIYLLTQTEAPITSAKEQLSLRYLHIRASKTGVLDHVLELYEIRHAEIGIGFRDWVAQDYDQAATNASFATKRSK